MKENPIFQLLTARLKGPKPGLPAQLKMVPEPRPGQKTYIEVQDTCLHAGVLVLLYPKKGRLHVVLTRRTSKVDHHRDQISFPGGEKAHEEIRVPPDAVRILGELTPLYIPPSNYCIYPIVAAAAQRPVFRRAPAEVAEVIEIPLDHLLNTKSVHREVWSLHGAEIVVPYYSFRGHKIWGATAMVLAELVAIIRNVVESA
jgi:hypothetical protein